MFRNSTNIDTQEKIKCLAQEPDCGKSICDIFEWSEYFSFQEVWLSMIYINALQRTSLLKVQDMDKTAVTPYHSTLAKKNEKRHSPKGPKYTTNLTLCQVITEAAVSLNRACLQI